MATNSTIYKANLQLSNLDSHYYHEHQLTIAKHPSETDERLMVRLLAFALYADENLEFGKGISSEDEPALWRKDLTGDIELWIEVGLPDERRIRKACGRAKQVVLILYGRESTVKMWWNQNLEELILRKNLTVIQLPSAATQEMSALATRTMQLSYNIESGQVSLLGESVTVVIEPRVLQRGA